MLPTDVMAEMCISTILEYSMIGTADERGFAPVLVEPNPLLTFVSLHKIFWSLENQIF